METNYKELAKQFLKDTSTIMEVIEAVPQKSPRWAKKGQKHGINYSVTLKKARHSYTFDFWGSIRDKELLELAEEAKERGFESSHSHALRDEFIKREINIVYMRFRDMNLIRDLKEVLKPSAYDILACLNTLQEDTLEDFCSAFGYDEDSRTAEKVFEACKEQDRQLRKLFTSEQLERLEEIN